MASELQTTHCLGSKPQVFRLIVAGWIMVFAVCLFWLPDSFHCQWYDVQISKYLAATLIKYPLWAAVVGHLNHSYEVFVNVIIMLGCQLLWCMHLPVAQRTQFKYQIMVCFITVSAWIHLVIKPFASLPKVSPVFMIPSVHQAVGKLYGIEHLLGSQHCLASGHAFSMFYSLFYLIHYRGSKLLKFGITIIAAIFSLNRVLIGEHWLSDFGFSVLLAYACVQVVQLSGIEQKLIAGLTAINQKLQQIKQQQ